MSSFFASKNERDAKPIKDVIRSEPVEAARPVVRSPQDNVSTIGSGMQITGNIVCDGTLHIYGRVNGDIHATELVICEGARVEGKIIAPDAVIRGSFNGSIHGNAVKLQKTAVVEGEVHNRSLAIEQDARFEGIARRLDKAVAGPSDTQAMAHGAANLQTSPVMNAQAGVPSSSYNGNGQVTQGIAPVIQ